MMGVNWIVVERREIGENKMEDGTNTIDREAFTSSSGNSHWIGMDKLLQIIEHVSWNIYIYIYTSIYDIQYFRENANKYNTINFNYFYFSV